jgi:hypothetical protein
MMPSRNPFSLIKLGTSDLKGDASPNNGRSAANKDSEIEEGGVSPTVIDVSTELRKELDINSPYTGQVEVVD